MARFWIIAPYPANPPENFDSVWDFDLSHNTISIGWPSFGNVLDMTEAELSEAVSRKYAHKPPQTRSLISNMLWDFYRVIQPGDVIVARRGRKTLCAVGKVVKSAIWSPGKNPETDHPVTWELNGKRHSATLNLEALSFQCTP
ncbi:hypothetical protein [Bradyrhizobium sp.]|uniref:hypothetical protein n=1 Tax=Bradyrhizobium sp. TaxID=376 RepID=UPI004037600F